MLPLITDRLIIRDFVSADWSVVHQYASNPEAVQYRLSGVKTPQQTQDFIRHAIVASQQQPRTTYDLAVVLAKGDRLIGECEL